MTPPHGPDPDDTGIDEVLRAAHARLVADLRGVLDVDGGAEQATEAGALAGLTGDLAGRLDVEGGLAAITAGPTAARGPARRTPVGGVDGPFALSAALRLTLRASPVFGRLRAAIGVLAALVDYPADDPRRRPVSSDLYSLDPVRELDPDRDLVDGLGLRETHRLAADLELVGRLDDALERARAVAVDPGRGNAGSLLRIVEITHHRVRGDRPAWIDDREGTRGGDRGHDSYCDLEPDLAGARRLAMALVLDAPVVDPARVRSLLTVLTSLRERTLDVARRRARGWAADCAERLELRIDPATADPARLRDELDAVGDDFRGADLRDARVPPAHYLDGIRWSAETRWPPDRAEAVRAASREVEPGVFEVTGRPGGRRSPSLRG